MVYRSVGDRIAVNLENLQLAISNEQAMSILEKLGFIQQKIDLVALARNLIGRTEYRRGAKPGQAPKIVDCSSMTKWLYGQTGIWLSRYSIDQRDEGLATTEPQAGDLAFAAGWKNYYWHDQNDGVGHVGMVTGNDSVIHAANSQRGVVEDPLDVFFSNPHKFRGFRRYLPATGGLTTLQMRGRQVETSQELRWIILQHC